MAAIRSKDTKPEILVRRIAHSLGFRYRLHRKDLPGKPDMVFPRSKKVIFVHGCYWHLHNCKYGRVQPKTNAEYWRIKRETNARRDKKNLDDLKRIDWSYLVIWECQLKDFALVEKKINAFFES